MPAAVEGDGEEPRAQLQAGSLRRIEREAPGHRAGQPRLEPDATASWVPDLVPLDTPDAWHPLDALYAFEDLAARLLIPIRREFHQYVNLRPMRLLSGLSSPLANRRISRMRSRYGHVISDVGHVVLKKP